MTAARAQADVLGSDQGLQPARGDWADWFRAADPGATRLLAAVQVVVTILVAMAAEDVLVRLTGALQIDTHGAALPPAQAAAVAAQHHAVLVVALMLGAVVALVAVFAAPMFATVREQTVSLALIPLPVVGGLALGLALAPYRLLGFAAIVVVLTTGAYLRRFGPRGFFGGNFAFIGTFFGLFLHGLITISALGWLTLEVCVAVAVAIALQLTVFHPRNSRTLRRLRRSFGARSRGVASVALAMVDLPPARRHEHHRLTRLLQRRTLRFNEAALMIDAYLERPGALPGTASAAAVHQRLFDVELAVTNIARFAVTLAAADLPPAVRGVVRDGLVAVGDLDSVQAGETGHRMLATLAELNGSSERSVHIIAHRFAGSLLGFAESLAALQAAAAGRPDPDPEPGVEFSAAATLVGGWLPGSLTVSATASAEASTRPGRLSVLDRLTFAPNVRVAVQMFVAVSAAIALGDLVNGRRYYWAVIAAFVTFMGAHNAGEQLRKGSLRVAGTVAGVFAGALLAHVVGHHVVLALVVILAALFAGMYLMRLSYAWFVVAITIAVSQLYVQLGEFSDDLLVLRLAETALGAGVALLTVLFVVPLRTGRVVRVATREYLTALGELAGTASERLLGHDDNDAVRAAARRLDVAYQALMSALAARGIPLLPAPSTRIQFTAALTASRNYARNLLADASGGAGFAGADAHALESATIALRSSLDEITASLQTAGGENRVYLRSASLFDRLSEALPAPLPAPAQLALRDFQLIDGSAATVAALFGLTVMSLDAAPTR